MKSLKEYLQNKLDKIYTIITDSGNDGGTIADYQDEVEFLTKQIERIDNKMKINKIKIGKDYKMGLPNYSSVNVSLHYEIELSSSDNVDEVQNLMFSKIDDDLREELKKSNKKKETK